MQKKKIEKFYLKKIKELIKHDKAYYNDDNPLISDKDYDDIKNEVIDLEQKLVLDHQINLKRFHMMFQCYHLQMLFLKKI